MEAVSERAQFLLVRRGSQATVFLMHGGEAHSVSAAQVLWWVRPRGFVATVRELMRRARPVGRHGHRPEPISSSFAVC
jgi:hypothetical protein